MEEYVIEELRRAGYGEREDHIGTLVYGEGSDGDGLAIAETEREGEIDQLDGLYDQDQAIPE